MGIITAITPQKKNPDRYSIFIDGKFALGVNKKVAEDADLKVGMKIEEKELERIVDKEKVSKAREYALVLLDYRERSKGEIKDRMRRKGHKERIIAETLEFLESQNLVNDERFARMWTESCLRRGYGRQKIYSDLKEKRVDIELINKVLKEVYSEVDEAKLALEMVEKKWGPLKKKDSSILRRISSFLKQRGFPFEVINEVMRQIAQ